MVKPVDMDKQFDLQQPFGVDYGRLENGLVYYVKCNPKPKKRAALALAVKIGLVPSCFFFFGLCLCN